MAKDRSAKIGNVEERDGGADRIGREMEKKVRGREERKKYGERDGEEEIFFERSNCETCCRRVIFFNSKKTLELGK